ncbi:MAG TPA: class I SAM-dependent methyltransferase [Chryseolinea sp.]
MRTAFYKILCLPLILISFENYGQGTKNQKELDEKVQAFLTKNKSKWRDLNVPYEDGHILHDLIVKNNYTAALEIGTSTGHSTIWIAWALSKTGGKLITIEIDPERHKKALENLEAVGLSDYVDARLADAHKLVKELNGPFDFVFSDADKTWYTQYFKDLENKLSPGACFTAHNVNSNFSGIADFMKYVKGLKGFETTVVGSSEGISLTCKKK